MFKKESLAIMDKSRFKRLHGEAELPAESS